MANSIEFAKNYTGILDEVYQRAAVSRCLNSGGRMVRAGRNAKEILIPKISVTGLGDYTRNVGYKTGSITYEYETHSFGYDRAIRLFADVMDVRRAAFWTASSRPARNCSARRWHPRATPTRSARSRRPRA